MCGCAAENATLTLRNGAFAKRCVSFVTIPEHLGTYTKPGRAFGSLCTLCGCGVLVGSAVDGQQPSGSGRSRLKVARGSQPEGQRGRAAECRALFQWVRDGIQKSDFFKSSFDESNLGIPQPLPPVFQKPGTSFLAPIRSSWMKLSRGSIRGVTCGFY